MSYVGSSGSDRKLNPTFRSENQDRTQGELADSLSAKELQKFINSEIFGLEMQVSSSIAKLIVQGQKCGNVSGIYMDVSNFTFKPVDTWVETLNQGNRMSSP